MQGLRIELFSFQNKINLGKFSKVLVLIFSLGLLSCGGGSSGSGDIPEPAAEIKEGTITGIASLGPIEDGTISVYDFEEGFRDTC